MTPGTRIRRSAAREDGFTMIVAIMALFISSLLVAAVFVGVDGDVTLTRANTSQKEAYYAAMAGISEYKYELSANSSYWKTCPSISTGTVPPPTGGSSTEETYKVKTLPATGSTESECLSGKQSAILEASGTAVGTFRIESTGIYGKGTPDEAKRSLVATFTHPGYLNYVYLSNFEEADPETIGGSEEECEYYRKERDAKHLTKCVSFPWIPADKIEGPFHTNDTAEMYGSPVFGQEGKNDPIEMNGGHVNGTPIFKGDGYTEKGKTLLPPEVAATELLSEALGKYTGRTFIVLEGNKMSVTLSNGTKETSVAFPANGVIAVENSSAGCPVAYKALETNYATEKVQDASCGDVYIKGEYTQSLTVIAQEDVIVVGNLTTEGGASGGEPTGNAALGLIAIGHARLYHPVTELCGTRTCPTPGEDTCSNQIKNGVAGEKTTEEFGLPLNKPVIDAAILSTKHSWGVDNFSCPEHGGELGDITIWGSIAENFRGRVTCCLTGGDYIKDYKYDERLKTIQPPDFLAPSSTEVTLSRVTAPPNGFGEG